MTAAQLQTTSGSSEVPDDATGKRNDYEFTLTAAASRDAGQLAGTIRTGLSRFVYGDVELLDGSTEDNGDRNYIEASAALRVMQAGTVLRPLSTSKFHRGCTMRRPIAMVSGAIPSA
jgi:hypothetical protein